MVISCSSPRAEWFADVRFWERNGSRSWACGQEAGRVDIADIDAALANVRDFIALLERNHAAWDSTGSLSAAGPDLRVTDNQIQEQLPLITQIAARTDTGLADRLRKDGGSYGWSYHRIEEASRQLAGVLTSLEETERILGPVGPRLAAANLHPWIWNAAVSLWDDGHLRE